MRKLTIIGMAVLASTALAACETVQEQVAEATTTTYNAHMTGAQEVGAGDPQGSGKAEVSIADDFDQICWDINNLTGIGPVTAAHIHAGAAGTNGPVVFTLFADAATGKMTGCRNGAEWTENRIEGNPDAFYVNVHTAEFPDGAIRGQLHD